MRITDISIDAFGSLSDSILSELGGGLNVVYGPNGSGKSTYLQFVRGLYCGFDEARNLRLVPPVASGKAGGSMGVHQGHQQFRISRHPLPDRSDRLAVGVSLGDVPDGERMRGLLGELDPQLMRLQFVVGGPENHSINLLVQTAMHHGIPMQPTRSTTTRYRKSMEVVRSERQRISNGQGGTGKLPAARQHLARTLLDLQKQERVIAQWRAEFDRMESDSLHNLRRLEAEAVRISLDLQAVVSDIREAEDQSWKPLPMRAVTRVVQVADRYDRLNEIEQELGHARSVLQDLARDRMGVSLESAPLLRGDEQSAERLLQRQRCAITSLEEGLLALREVSQKLELENGDVCRCQSFSQQVSASVQAMQKLTYLLCQDIARFQQHEQRRQLHEQRDGIDRCEAELLTHIHRLNEERESILTAATSRVASLKGEAKQETPSPSNDVRLRCVTGLHHAGCRCREHESLSQEIQKHETSQTIIEYVPQPVVVDERLSGWRQRRAELEIALESAIRRWRAARVSRRDGLLQQIIHGERSAAALRMKIDRLQREVQTLQTEWKSLAIAEAALDRLQQRTVVNAPAAVIQEASQHMARLTVGSYPAIDIKLDRRELIVISASGQPLPVHVLSRGTQDQLALSMRLALADAFAARGLALPLVFDDLLVDCDRDRLQVAVKLLKEAAARGRQIVYLTCQEPLVQLFEGDGTNVRTLPGEVRPPAVQHEIRTGRTVASTLRAAAIEIAPLNTPFPSTIPQQPSVSHAETQSRDSNPLDIQIDVRPVTETSTTTPPPPRRTLPTEPHWLRVDSPVSALPSISEQMIPRLGAIGIRQIGDLVELSLDDANPKWDLLQLSASRLRIWQSEARLLCCVPDITGRDAQILVAVGILTPQELAQADAEGLIRRIDRMRGDQQSGWINAGYVWPDRIVVTNWIAAGQRARTFREASLGTTWTSRRSEQLAPPAAIPKASLDRDGETGSQHPDRERSPEEGSPRVPRSQEIRNRDRFRTPAERIAERRRRRAERSQRDHESRERAARLRAERERAEREESARDNSDRTPRTFTVLHRDGVESQRQHPSSSTPFVGTTGGSQSDSADRSEAKRETVEWRFYLNLDSPVVDAPSIGPTTAKRLERAGVITVADLLNRDAAQVAGKLQHRRITADAIRLWQDQSRLMCRVPELRGHDAQVLVACGIHEPEQVAAMSPEALFNIVGPFVDTKDGQRLLRSAKTPDLAEVTDWILWSGHARTLKAA